MFCLNLSYEFLSPPALGALPLFVEGDGGNRVGNSKVGRRRLTVAEHRLSETTGANAEARALETSAARDVERAIHGPAQAIE